GRGMVCGAVLDTAEVLQDPHLRERGTIVDLDHPTRGRFSTIISPLRLSDSPVTPRRAPLFGEHTEEVLRSLAGYTAEDVAASRQARPLHRRYAANCARSWAGIPKRSNSLCKPGCSSPFPRRCWKTSRFMRCRSPKRRSPG